MGRHGARGKRARRAPWVAKRRKSRTPIVTPANQRRRFATSACTWLRGVSTSAGSVPGWGRVLSSRTHHVPHSKRGAGGVVADAGAGQKWPPFHSRYAPRLSARSHARRAATPSGRALSCCACPRSEAGHRTHVESHEMARVEVEGIADVLGHLRVACGGPSTRTLLVVVEDARLALRGRV